MEHRPTTCACGKQLSERNRVGKCRSCYFRSSATDPVLIAKRRATMRANSRTPEGAARMRRMSLARVSWCPIEYLGEYRRLVYVKRCKAVEARAIIEAQITTDAARYARTGQLQQSRRAG